MRLCLKACYKLSDAYAIAEPLYVVIIRRQESAFVKSDGSIGTEGNQFKCLETDFLLSKNFAYWP